MADAHTTTSLLTEHFRYTPLTLVDDIINTTNEVLYRTISAVETGLLSCPPSLLGFDDRRAAHPDSPPASPPAAADTSLSTPASQHHPDLALFPEATREIAHGVHQLETLLEATVDRNFDKVEIYVLRNILAVPGELARWVRLRHYEGLDFARAAAAPDVDTVYALRAKLRETEKLHAALRAERARGAARLAEVRGLLQGELGWVAAHGREGGAGGLRERMGGAARRLPELRRLLGVLRARAEGGLEVAKAEGEEEEERREYIEGQARRTLEGQGVEVGSGEGLAGSGWRAGGGPGSGVGKEEVSALEGIEKALGGQGERRES